MSNSIDELRAKYNAQLIANTQHGVISAAKEWSKYQLAIFVFILEGIGSAIIEAVAGSGKTTTIVEAYNYTKALGTAIFLAFNKAIADELAKKGLNARTFHSICFQVALSFKRARMATPDKLYKIVTGSGHFSDKDIKLYGTFIRKLVSLAKQSGVDCLIENTDDNWMNIINHHDLNLESDDANLDRAIELSKQLLQLSNDSNMIDYDDMLYFVVKYNLSLPKYDFVFVDEAQDTNAIQRAILRKIMKPTSRLIAVGDPAQAIYGFRGADSNSLNQIAEDFQCTRLPLTVSYRCPKNVVKFAQNWVKHIEASDTAQDGTVTHLGEKWDANTFQAGDMVVCRTTKPLIELGYKMLKARKPVQIMGKDLGEGLKALIKRLQGQGIAGLCEKLEIWTDREVEKAKKQGNDSKAANIRDKSDAILCLIASLDENNRTIPELLRVIDTLFADKGACTTLATIHRAKGLEANRVYWLNRSQCPSKWAKQAWQLAQEENLCYVAVTRAKQELILIEEQRGGSNETELNKA